METFTLFKLNKVLSISVSDLKFQSLTNGCHSFFELVAHAQACGASGDWRVDQLVVFANLPEVMALNCLAG